MSSHVGARRECAATGTQVGQRALRKGGMRVECLEARLLLARDIYVDVGTLGPSHSGSSWVNAYVDLQPALGAAASGDRILVADGVYRPTATTNRAISFQLKNGVSLLGGYAGYGAAKPDTRDVSLYRTILSGDIGTPGNNVDNSYHVVTGGSGITYATLLDGFTITAGNAAGSSPPYYGGGIYLVSASPTLANCAFSANSAGNSGGGMYNSSSSPRLTDCTFSGNSAYYYGGGMYNSSSSPALTTCTFSENSAASTSDTVGGGGMFNYSSSSPTLTNCTFSRNSAASSSTSSTSGGYGGGMYNYDSSSPVLTNCTFGGNSATGAHGYGGGMYSYSSSPTLTNCVFIGNAAGGTYSYGGGMESLR